MEKDHLNSYSRTTYPLYKTPGLKFWRHEGDCKKDKDGCNEGELECSGQEFGQIGLCQHIVIIAVDQHQHRGQWDEEQQSRWHNDVDKDIPTDPDVRGVLEVVPLDADGHEGEEANQNSVAKNCEHRVDLLQCPTIFGQELFLVTYPT